MLNICNKFINRLNKQYKKNITVSEYIIERLINKNINTAFGYNGGAALPLFDAISKNDKFNMIFNRHEQSSGHCAESYSKEILSYLNMRKVDYINRKDRLKWLTQINVWKNNFRLNNNTNELTSNYIISTLSNILHLCTF